MGNNAMRQLRFEPNVMIDASIERLKHYEPEEGYWLGFSGGQHSVILHDLAERAKVKFDAHYCVSPIDPPEVRDFIRQEYPQVQWDYHARGFFGKPLMSNGPPMRQFRWCCRTIKEAGGEGRRKLTGILWAEGASKRRGRLMYEPCYSKVNTDFLHPMIDWTHDDVKAYIDERSLRVCSLYAEGLKRIGCVPCPFHRDVDAEMARFPEITKLWRMGLDRYFDKRIERGTALQWATKDEFWEWWVHERG